MKYKIPVGIGDFVINGKYSWISVMLPGNCNLCSPNRSAGSLLTTTSSQVPPHHVWQQQLSHEEDHGISRISWPQGKVWSWVWHFLYEMLICISFRFIKAIWKYVRKKKGEALFIFCFAHFECRFHGSETWQSCNMTILYICNTALRQCGTHSVVAA